jgi:hypothetical protein
MLNHLASTTGMSAIRRQRSFLISAILLLCLSLTAIPIYAQTTYGTVLGTVKDASGAVVPDATVTLHNIDLGTTRTAQTNKSGDYLFQFAPPDHYSIEVTKKGFETETIQNLQLFARQPLRADAVLPVGAVSQNVTVSESTGVLNLDTAQISTQLSARSIQELPTNFRTNGSTSPITMLQALPGVQPDTSTSSNGHPSGFSVEGGLPFQSLTTVDGISTQNVTGNSPLPDAFPSAEMIAEIRVDGVLNPASYDQPGEITTTTKAGTNNLHGSAYWNVQNRAFDATPYGTTVLPEINGNDYGFSLGGPIYLPHIYNGHNRSFFFGDFEGFQFPRGQSIQSFVPTQLERQGNFSNEGVTIVDPNTGLPFAGDTIPANRISNISRQFLTLYPLPNTGNLNTSHAANYIANYSNNYSSNQFDVRADQYIGQKQQMFGRYTYKDISEVQPEGLLLPNSTNANDYYIFLFSHNFSFTRNFINEFRYGFTINDSTTGNPFNGRKFTAALGLQGIGPSFPFNGIPEIDFPDLTSEAADHFTNVNQSRLSEVNDNLTYTHGNHSFEAGFDEMSIEDISTLSFAGADNYGGFTFSGTFTGSSFADFLLGVPIQTVYDDVKFNNDGKAKYWAGYGQDQYRVFSNLTLSYGLRFEFHPGYTDVNGDIGNFDRDIPGGAIIYPDGYRSILAPGELATINACPAPSVNGVPCTQVLSNSQVNLPNTLRTPTRIFLPRFGLAWRPFNSDSTVIRSGFGIYDITTLGSVYYSLTGTLQSNVLQFNNQQTKNGPLFKWPQVQPGGTSSQNGIVVGPLGSAYFGTANSIHWSDPYSMQWVLAVDHNLGNQTALHVSFIGMKTDDLVWAPNDNDMSVSRQYAVNRPLTDRPFPNWGTINTRAPGAQSLYMTLQTEVVRRFNSGFSFDSTYNLSRSMADNQGPNATSFVSETGGGRATWLYDRHLDYGHTYGTRRNRWITSGLYDIPFGHGRRFGNGISRMADEVLGGWQLSGIFLWQSGPFLTPYSSGNDPSGTGSGSLFGRNQHPDRVPGTSFVPRNRTRLHWLNPGAVTCPATPGYVTGNPCLIGSSPGTSLAPIGRFGTATVGSIIGPGTVNLSSGLHKVFPITDGITMQLAASFTNVLNHTNLADPNTNIGSSQFGQITSGRTSDFGGARTGQFSARIEF